MTHQKRCARHGCERLAIHGQFCSLGCRAVANEVVAAHHLRQALGASEAVDEYLETAEDLVAAWVKASTAKYKLRRMAREEGWSNSQWLGLLRGDVDVRRTSSAPE